MFSTDQSLHGDKAVTDFTEPFVTRIEEIKWLNGPSDKRQIYPSDFDRNKDLGSQNTRAF